MRALMLCLLLWSGNAHGGAACHQKAVDPVAFAAALDLARATRDALDASGAQVVLIGRAGQDLSKYGLRYSHMGLAWRDHPKGRWIIRHELNACGSARSALFDDGLANFFLDDMFRYEALLVIPGAADRDRLAATLATSLPQQLHAPAYSMLSYAFSTSYQNSNQWVLETYAASVAGLPLTGRSEAQAWLKLAGFTPITIHLPAAVRLGARMFRVNVAFDDHPYARRMAGEIDTVTVESIARFVQQRDPDARTLTVSAP